MRCYYCYFCGDKEDFKLIGTEVVEGHLLKKFECPKCHNFHWYDGKEIESIVGYGKRK